MRIEHIAMYVNDLERAKIFFCRYFGAVPGRDYHNKNTDFRSCFLSFSDGARLEIMIGRIWLMEKKIWSGQGLPILLFLSGAGKRSMRSPRS